MERLRGELTGVRPPHAPPARAETGWILFTPVIAAVTAIVFAYAAAAYRGLLTSDGSPLPPSCAAPPSPPAALAAWATAGHVGAAPWCHAPTPPWTLDGAYLASWGGISPGVGLPPAARVFSAALLHASTAHWAANAALTLALGAPLEHARGSLAVAAIWIAAVAGGALAAAAREPPCGIVVGASGGAFGLAAAAVVDAALAFPILPRPILHAASLAGGVAALVAAAAASPHGVSHWSHGGGAAAAAGAAALLFGATSGNRGRVTRLVVAVAGVVVVAVTVGAAGASAAVRSVACGPQEA